MDAQHSEVPVASFPGALAVALWSVYVLSALTYAPDIRPSMLTIGCFGLLADLAVLFNFAHWRLIVMLASAVQLTFHAIQVIGMIAAMTEFKISALPSALGFYYRSAWDVTVGMFEEQGVISGLTHGFFEFVVPIVSVVLIGVILITWRSQRRVSGAG